MVFLVLLGEDYNIIGEGIEGIADSHMMLTIAGECVGHHWPEKLSTRARCIDVFLDFTDFTWCFKNGHWFSSSMI